MVAIGKFKDLTGQRFGKLIVIKRVENNDRNKVRWLCQCDCGNTHITISYNLTHGLCQSCGCLQQEIIETNRQRRYNTYDLSGTYGIGYTSKGEEFYFDLEDYDKIKDYCWYIDSNGYVIAHDNTNNNKIIRMHRLIMNVNRREIFVDHIYHNKNDNRKSQLRLVSPQQNASNCKINKSNTSGYKGVYWHEPAQKWEVLIQYNNKLINLGLYSNKNDAIKVRQDAEIKYFGEYRYRENPNLIQDNT